MEEKKNFQCQILCGNHLVFICTVNAEMLPVELTDKLCSLSCFEYSIGGLRHFILENSTDTTQLCLEFLFYVNDPDDIEVETMEIDYDNEVPEKFVGDWD